MKPAVALRRVAHGVRSGLRWGVACGLGLCLLAAAGGAAAAGIHWFGADGSAVGGGTPDGSAGGSIGSASYSTWSLEGDTVIARFMLPRADAQRVAGTDIDVLVQQRIGDYLLAHLAVRARAEDCQAIDQGYDIGRVDPLTEASGLYGFEIFFRCAQPSGVVLEDRALFDRLPGQVNFARVQVNGSRFSEQLFTSARRTLALPHAGAPRAAGLGRYLALGAAHIVRRWDRLCFLLGALLLARRMRHVLRIATGLAAGYALSLPAALSAALAPRGRLLEAGMGFLVALLALQMIAQPLRRRRGAALGAAGALLWLAAVALLGHAIWPVMLLAGAALFAGSYLAAQEGLEQRGFGWLLLPAVFGFLDGFALPAALGPLQLSGAAMLAAVAGFDVGALLAAVAVLAVFGALLAGASVWQRTRASALALALAGDVAAAGLGGLGVFWMLSRLHG